MAETQQTPQSNIPAPMADITVRTMQSDIESMGATGGVRPEGKMVSLDRKQALKAPVNYLPWVIIIGAILIAGIILSFVLMAAK